jgi:hypothetical protein
VTGTDVTVTFPRHLVGPVLRAIGARLNHIDKTLATVPLSLSETAMSKVEADDLKAARALIDEARR